MASLYDASVGVLSELVGAAPARMCVHSACVQMGKPSEGLVPGDFEAIAGKVREDMSRFASPDLIEEALAKIKSAL